ncbi:MAG: hypothetical protein KJ847_04255 [Firmicutes bacterium]|nr:hypothetical protein [Bacillota bacterium]
MVDKRLEDYMRKVVKKGDSLEKAEQNLIDAGYEKEPVQKAAAKMKRRKFEEIALAVLAVIIFVALIGYLLGSEILVENEPEVVEIPEFILLEEAIISGDLTNCEQFDTVMKSACIKEIKNETTVVKTTLLDDIIEEVALTKDASLCDQLTSAVEIKICLKEAES